MKTNSMKEDERALFGAINIAILLVTFAALGFAGYMAYDFYSNECGDYDSIVSCVAGRSVTGTASTIGGGIGLAVTGLFQWGMKLGGRDPQETGESSPGWWPNFLPW